MTAGEITLLAADHRRWNQMFYQKTAKSPVTVVPTPADIDALLAAYRAAHGSGMHADYAWRVAAAYLN